MLGVATFCLPLAITVCRRTFSRALGSSRSEFVLAKCRHSNPWPSAWKLFSWTIFFSSLFCHVLVRCAPLIIPPPPPPWLTLLAQQMKMKRLERWEKTLETVAVALSASCDWDWSVVSSVSVCVSGFSYKEMPFLFDVHFFLSCSYFYLAWPLHRSAASTYERCFKRARIACFRAENLALVRTTGN